MFPPINTQIFLEIAVYYFRTGAQHLDIAAKGLDTIYVSWAKSSGPTQAVQDGIQGPCGYFHSGIIVRGWDD